MARRPQAAVALLLVASMTGCWGDSRSSTRRSPSAGRAAQQRASEQSALFNSIRDQLKTLPESAQMDLAPPTVVLDARRTLDGEEILATLTRPPGAPDGPVNVIQVPRRNVRFRGQVEPGDIAKYYVKPDDDTMARELEGGGADIATYEAIDLLVAQVLDDATLLIQGGLNFEVTDGYKLEVWRIADDRMQEIGRQLGDYVSRREPPLGWHPSPDESEIERLTERLNQWLRQSRIAGTRANREAWKRPALLDTLPQDLADSDRLKPYLAEDDLAVGYFRPYEARMIQGTIWFRDVSRWARGSAIEPTAIALALLEWTTRNVQLVESDTVPPRWAWEVLLRGQASPAQQAWVLASLCEQQNLTAAIVSVPTETGPRPLVGVLDGDQLRLFDPQLGLPIPGVEPGTVASLAEVQQDDGPFRALDLEGTPYPLTADAARAAEVTVVATPFGLSARANALASKLPATESMLLTADLDARAERLLAAQGIDSAGLWSEPFATLLAKLTAKPSQRRQAVREFLPYAWRPQLWRGRGHHFRGAAAAVGAVDGEEAEDHQVARSMFMNRRVRPSDERLLRVPEEKRGIYRSAKTLATLYLGLLSLDEEAPQVAKNWLENPALDRESAKEFEQLIRFNLAVACEQTGETDRAIELLESIEGPPAPGAKLRARRLREAADAAPPAEAP